MSPAFVPRAVRALVLAGLVGWIATATAAEDSVPDLSGVWGAEHIFGPEVRGPLTIAKRGQEWIASIAGRAAPARVEGDKVWFVLGDGKGSFRGAFAQNGAVIAGYWRQKPTIFIGNAFASPVTLKKAEAELWRGDVVPLDDRMTLYLMNTPKPDGGFTTFLRNPERNVGLFLEPDRLERRSNELLLERTDSKTGATSVVAHGSYDAPNAVMSFYVPGAGGSFDFTRAGPDSAFYPRGQNPTPYLYHQPLPRDDGWPVLTDQRYASADPNCNRHLVSRDIT